MSGTPISASTVKVVAMEPLDGTKVRITMELVVDVHRLTEVSSQMLKAAMNQVTAEKRSRTKKS
jgi:hypothetical protein